MNNDISNESLHEATKRYPDQSTPGYNDHWNITKQTAFTQGANWQKEKDKAIIEAATRFIEYYEKYMTLSPLPERIISPIRLAIKKETK